MSPHKLQQLLGSLVEVGTVSQVQLQPLRYKVTFDEERETEWIRAGVFRAGNARVWAPLSVGEQVLVLRIFRGLEFIVCSFYRDSFAQPDNRADVFKVQFADGTYLEYSQPDQHLKAVCVGSVDMVAPGGFVLTGDVDVNGEIRSTGDQIAGGISQINHTHGGIMPGGGNTDIPNGGS